MLHLSGRGRWVVSLNLQLIQSTQLEWNWPFPHCSRFLKMLWQLSCNRPGLQGQHAFSKLGPSAHQKRCSVSQSLPLCCGYLPLAVSRKLVSYKAFIPFKAGFHSRLSLSQNHKRSRNRAYDLVKVKNRSRKQSHKSNVIGVRGIRTFPFLPIPLTTLSLMFCSWSSENQIAGVGRRRTRMNQSQCTFPRFVIGSVLLLLLLTPTIWFSLDHTQNVSDGVVNRIETLLSLDHKLYTSDNNSDSDSVASENQLLLGHFRVPKASWENQFHLHESELKIIFIMALHFKPGFETAS